MTENRGNSQRGEAADLKHCPIAFEDAVKFALRAKTQLHDVIGADKSRRFDLVPNLFWQTHTAAVAEDEP